MLKTGSAALMRIYTDERAKGEDGPLFQTIVEMARGDGIAGATVLRAVVGFGESRSVQRASILDLSGNLPLVIELVDEKRTLVGFMDRLAGMQDIGLVVLQDIEVLHYDGKTEVAASGRP